MKPDRLKEILNSPNHKSYLMVKDRGSMAEFVVHHVWRPMVLQSSEFKPIWFKPSFTAGVYSGLTLSRNSDYMTILKTYPNPSKVVNWREYCPWLDKVTIKVRDFLVDKKYIDLPEKRVGDSVMVKVFQETGMWIQIKEWK